MWRVVYLLAVTACRFGFADRPDAEYRDACPPTSCTGDQLVDCHGVSTCAYGCATAGAPHCLALVPSNGLTADLLAGADAQVSSADLQFDTDTGAIAGLRADGEGVIDGIGFTVVDGIGVFTMNSARVPAGGTWTATGSHALALFAAMTIDVHGTIDVGSNDNQPGPGGTSGGIGDARATCDGQDGRFKFSNNTGAGGGGAGGISAGAIGAATVADVNGASLGGGGGLACAATPSTIPLRGGNGGGAGGTESLVIMGGSGGGGGGGLQLVAMSRVFVDGVVGASGAGGETIASGKGGAGGGGGGALLLEAHDVMFTGTLAANGGAGGQAVNNTASALRGQRGQLGSLPAAGAGGGGNGGTGTVAPAAGTTMTSGAGGGGAAGRIEIRAITRTLGGTSSPAATQSQAVLE